MGGIGGVCLSSVVIGYKFSRRFLFTVVSICSTRTQIGNVIFHVQVISEIERGKLRTSFFFKSIEKKTCGPASVLNLK